MEQMSTNSRVRTSLVIPCYNEAEGIVQLCEKLAPVVEKLREQGGVEVVFVDDGSTDGTSETIRLFAGSLPYRIIAHSTNRGLGAALRTGFNECRGEEIVTLDSDCTYDPIQALHLLTTLRAGNDVVTGGPYHPDGTVGGVDRWRLMLSKLVSFLYRMVVPVRLSTYTSSLRAYRRDILTKLEAKDDGFLYVTQVLISAILKGARVAEVPAVLTSRRFGSSKMKMIPVGISHLRFLLQIPWMRIRRASQGIQVITGAGRLIDLSSLVLSEGNSVMRRRVYSQILKARNRHLLVIDVAIFMLTPILSVILRLEQVDKVVTLAAPLAGYILVSMLLKLGIFSSSKFYRHIWRYASVDEIVTIASVTMISSVVCLVGFFAVLALTNLIPAGFPRSLPFLDGILTTVLIGGVRLSIRVASFLNERHQTVRSIKNVLIVGAGISGSTIVKELRANPQLGFQPICYVDDDPVKKGAMIHGVKVVGTLADIPHLLDEHTINEVIIAMPTAPGEVIRQVVQACKKEHVVSKTIPSVFEILSGSAVAQLREVRIEDLLRRGAVEIETKDVQSLLAGARVMVTGAGGSIGSELCRQIVRFRPKDLVLLGHGEDSIFQIAAELRNRHGFISESVRIHTVIADIRDRDRMDQVFAIHKPDIVFHAAAHKHVGLMEKNLGDAVTNNVGGTRILVELADKHDVSRLVMISSDKAVNPTSIMGVTKRIAELVVHDVAERTGRNFVAVRFGNVLGSSGSVVPILRQQIQEGGPIKITHPDVSRFFMTIPEAVQLVLQSGTMGEGGEVFVLDMGKPIKILDLARDLLRLSGLTEGVDIEISFVGLQKGEKMHEELFYETEKAEPSRHEKILVWRNGIGSKTKPKTPSDVIRKVERLMQTVRNGEMDLVQRALTDLVPQYRHNGLEEAESDNSKTMRGVVIPIKHPREEVFGAAPRSVNVR